MRGINCIAGRGRYRVSCRVFVTGEGLIAHLLGGEKPHVGAVALGIPRPSLRGEGASATTSVLTLTGHKDDEVARPAATTLAAACQAPVVVVAGIHLDGATPGELVQLQENARRAVAGVLKYLKGVRRTPGPSGSGHQPPR
ncbi:hypothetical protein [Neomoorella thermoacetica]|uniref:Prenylated flavin chaperone LpdD-like domain-containing protein n=3 Tax=Neomoorella thermoacetica TaxID=1525 RepID=A0A1D7X6Q7_NEOTH|nr:hypothetical protein [Moorella thermoacetica]AKX92929.1 hypothetical protein MOTHE_c01040 [Moorella thermoacetica]AKX95482.1 hypothetical protein MOTHA_c01040 [Moorella thermoacetica]AOQ22599.1 hypothetical protein Maut_00104 [Moorella thermoacetica]APC07289.1 hypothetical protein MTJW_00990 [Moorella thermoacetica]OIQ10285.1 hypothetical protein MOOR_03650 [Moorella thermoacetica]